MTQYSRHPSGFRRRAKCIADAKAASYPVENEAGQPLQRVAAKRRRWRGRRVIIAARATYMNDLTVQETVLQQQCDEETASLQIDAELARQCASLCSMLHNEQ